MLSYLATAYRRLETPRFQSIFLLRKQKDHTAAMMMTAAQGNNMARGGDCTTGQPAGPPHAAANGERTRAGVDGGGCGRAIRVTLPTCGPLAGGKSRGASGRMKL